MKRNKWLMVSTLVMLAGVCGCGSKKETRDTYVEGSDFQYQYIDNSAGQLQQHGKEGEFFLRGSFLYYVEKKTNQVVPLCNKADCLHDEETDLEQMQECHAFVGYMDFDPENLNANIDYSIAYSDGFVYFLQRRDLTEPPYVDQVLWRFREDGSGKEEVYHWEEEVVCNWIIHRNALYYIEQSYHVPKGVESDAEPEQYFVLRELALDGKKESKTIYEPEKNQHTIGMDSLQAYGNHVYFLLATEEIDTKQDYTNEHCWNYDIQTGEANQIEIPNAKKGDVMAGDLCFWKDKIIPMIYNVDTMDFAEKQDIYMLDLDGKNAKIFQKDVPYGMNYQSDGTYLYRSNWTRWYKKFDKEGKIDVFDEKDDQIDTLKMDFNATREPMGIGDMFYSFRWNDEGTKAVVECFDKTKIGSYKGRKPEMKKIGEIKENAFLKEEKQKCSDGE